jgi:molecular chaperone DnaK (HSP70)
MSRYVIGIDLGTTNSALAYADWSARANDQTCPIESLAIPQVVAMNEASERALLPSFLYLPSANEFPVGALALPWTSAPDRVAGAFAREQGARVPGRLVSSAKSWLCHAGVDRRAPILPWVAAGDVTRVSPVTASSAFLEHLRDGWNTRVAGKAADERLENQDVLLTVPASFDPVARELTMEAAAQAGLKHVTLLEEPQAAFYAWLAFQGDAWRMMVKVGDIILVCDVGGGTTDFTLIAVTGEAGELVLSRLAVGEHILLGGDNMDLALAYEVASRLPQGMEGLDAGQRIAMGHACRTAKETLLSDRKENVATVTVLGRGSKVVGGSIKTELARDVLERVLLDGFLPRCGPAEVPLRGRRVGMAEIGLPYAADPAITRHLARFLGQQAGSLHTGGTVVLPSAVLFNGGVFKARELRRRILELLSDWAGRPVPELESSDPDLAVARGAAYYGQVRRGKGVRIRGGAACSYYVGLETAAPAVPGIPQPIKALCVVPMGMEEGTETNVPGPEIGLIVGEPAQFRFLGSTVRRDDAAGTTLERWSNEELEELAPLETALEVDGGRAGELVPVRLHARLTEVGSLELSCQSTRDPRRWKLEFNVREPREN